MHATCSANNKYYEQRKRRRQQDRLHRDLLLQRKIDANRRKYPQLFKILDSESFDQWYQAAVGHPFDMRKAANIEELVYLLNSMQAVYGEIPD